MLNITLHLSSQDIGDLYLNFLPSDRNVSDLKPSDIPSEQVLKQMGFSNLEMLEILDFKYQRGKYKNNIADTSILESTVYNSDLEILDVSLDDTIIYPKAKIYGQDLFRSQGINYYDKSMDANAPDNYELGPGDELNIAVWGRSEYSSICIIDPRGYIDLHGFGRVYLKGLTLSKAKSLIRNRLNMSKSSMDVTLVYSIVILVNIVGEVYNPGSYSIPAINTAYNAIMAANGPTQIGSVRNIYIKRNGELVDSLDVYQFLYNPQSNNDVFLQDGDYIIVEPAKSLIEIKGEVNRPYTYEIKSTDNVKDMIKYAGGFTSQASRNIITHRTLDANGNYLVNDVHVDDMSTTFLHASDELIVNKVNSRVQNYVTLKGSVGVEGDYQYIVGERLLSLLERSNCLNNYLYENTVYVLRLNDDQSRTHISINLSSILDNVNHEDNIIINEFDIVNVLSIDDFQDFDSVSVFGYVMHPKDILYGKNLLLKDAIKLSGGFKNESSGGRIEVSRVHELQDRSIVPTRSIILVAEIKDDLTLDIEAANFRLHPKDQIFIRKNPEYKDPVNIYINGEVNYPGRYFLLSEGDRLTDIIKRSGGFTEYAFLEGSKLYRKISQNVISEDLETISDEFKKVILSESSLYKKYSNKLIESEINQIEIEDNTQQYDSEYIVIAFDFSKSLSNPSSPHNIILKEGDSLVVSKNLDVVHIGGDLYNFEGNGISAPHFSSKRADYYINNFAGGYAKNNDKTRTTVIYPNGAVKRTLNFGFFRLSPKVVKGSTINLFSKENIDKIKNPIDWNNAIENTLIKATGVISLYLLLDRIQNSF